MLQPEPGLGLKTYFGCLPVVAGLALLVPLLGGGGEGFGGADMPISSCLTLFSKVYLEVARAMLRDSTGSVH